MFEKNQFQALVSALACLPVVWWVEIKERYGFNRTSTATFITDRLKEWFISGLLMAGFAFIILNLFETFGPQAWILGWLGGLFAQFLALRQVRAIEGQKVSSSAASPLKSV